MVRREATFSMAMLRVPAAASDAVLLSNSPCTVRGLAPLLAWEYQDDASRRTRVPRHPGTLRYGARKT
jgi:hypothetical protein